MTEPPCRYSVTITVDRDRDGGHLPNPAEFAVAADQAASARAASIVNAHTASQIVSIVCHRPGRGSACGRGRRPGRRVRCAETSGRVADPLKGWVVAVLGAAVVFVDLAEQRRRTVAAW
jgi:hypothetical protein